MEATTAAFLGWEAEGSSLPRAHPADMGSETVFAAICSFLNLSPSIFLKWIALRKFKYVPLRFSRGTALCVLPYGALM